MVACMKELSILKDCLEQLMDIVKNVESGELPYFYQYLDTMKNNIDIFFRVDCSDAKGLCDVLRRDWMEAQFVLLGIQYYDLRRTKPDVEQIMCVRFAQLIGEVEGYLNRCQKLSENYCICHDRRTCTFH